MMTVEDLNKTTSSNMYQAAMSEQGRYERQIGALHNITTVINRSTDLNRIFNTTLAEMAGTLNLRSSTIWLWDNKAQRFQIRSYIGLTESLMQELTHCELVAEALENGAGIDYNGLLHNLTSLFLQHAEQYSFSSVLNIPLVAQQQLVGIITFFEYDATIFNLELKHYLGMIANLVGTAVQQAQLYEKVQNQAANLEIEVAARTAELQAANEKLKLARDLAEKASKEKSIFLANMNHELRTPLNAILGYSELLQDEALETQPDFIPPLQKINIAGKHLLNMLSGILDLSKIEAGRILLAPENLKVANLVEEVVNINSPMIEKSANRLEVRCAPDLGTIWADMGKLRQVLSSVLHNALKFTENGLVRLEAWRETDGDTDWINFKVNDTGIGMSQQTLQKLFKQSIQASPAAIRKYGGTGLGLVISQRYCQMMNGNITVESELGKGSTFLIRLVAQSNPNAPLFYEENDIPPFFDEQ